MSDQLAHILRQTEESYKGIHPGMRKKYEGWEKWYAQWMLTLFDVQSLLGVKPSQVTLERLLLAGDAEYSKKDKSEDWADVVAQKMMAIVKKHLDATLKTHGSKK